VIALRGAYSTQIDHRFHGDCDQSFHSKAISGSTSKSRWQMARG
jgi:hypothetical protein